MVAERGAPFLTIPRSSKRDILINNHNKKCVWRENGRVFHRQQRFYTPCVPNSLIHLTDNYRSLKFKSQTTSVECPVVVRTLITIYNFSCSRINVGRNERKKKRMFVIIGQSSKLQLQFNANYVFSLFQNIRRWRGERKKLFIYFNF